MTKTVTRVATAMREVLGSSYEAIERRTGFCRRQSKLAQGGFVRAVVLGALSTSEPTLDTYAQTAAALGVVVRSQAFDERFDERAAALLRAVFERAASQIRIAAPAAGDLLACFTAVWVEDSTHIALPEALSQLWRGAGGDGAKAAIKAQTRLDLKGGELVGPVLVPGHTNDQGFEFEHQITAGALSMADLGYWKLARFARLAEAGAFWLSRLSASVGVFDARDQPLDLVASLAAETKGRLERQIRLGADRLACRLVAERVPVEVAEARREKLRQAAAKNGLEPRARTLALAAWTLVVTNIPRRTLSARAVLELGRARWQIEILFKVWKSGGHIDESRSTKAWRVLCEVYAKLTAMLLAHWVLMIRHWSRPERSLFKALDVVRRHAALLVRALASGRGLASAITAIDHALESGSTTQTRRKRPSTFQRLQRVSNP